MKTNPAFSGLEAAIVLIAFVVVAAVFSYVMLGAGFFATQKSQEVTYSGIKQSTSNIVIDGSQYGQMDAATAKLWKVTFFLSVPQGGQPQLLEDIQYTATVNDAKIPWSDNADAEGSFHVAAESGVTILKAGETAEMTLNFGQEATANCNGPKPGGSFTLEVRPKVGASSILSKQLVTGYKGGVII